MRNGLLEECEKYICSEQEGQKINTQCPTGCETGTYFVVSWSSLSTAESMLTPVCNEIARFSSALRSVNTLMYPCSVSSQAEPVKTRTISRFFEYVSHALAHSLMSSAIALISGSRRVPIVTPSVLAVWPAFTSFSLHVVRILSPHRARCTHCRRADIIFFISRKSNFTFLSLSRRFSSSSITILNALTATRVQEVLANLAVHHRGPGTHSPKTGVPWQQPPTPSIQPEGSIVDC